MRWKKSAWNNSKVVKCFCSDISYYKSVFIGLPEVWNIQLVVLLHHMRCHNNKNPNCEITIKTTMHLIRFTCFFMLLLVLSFLVSPITKYSHSVKVWWLDDWCSQEISEVFKFQFISLGYKLNAMILSPERREAWTDNNTKR